MGLRVVTDEDGVEAPDTRAAATAAAKRRRRDAAVGGELKTSSSNISEVAVAPPHGELEVSFDNIILS